MKNNNFYLTIYTTFALYIVAMIWMDFNVLGFILGILYGQTIEWFVHGYIQHSRLKIFTSYRKNHIYHHKYPKEDLPVQPLSYFIIGSILLLAPLYWIDGFVSGYLFIYIFINVIHFDLHSDKRILSNRMWNTRYFKLITYNHIAHHNSTKLKYTTHSVTNPYLDIIFYKIRLTQMNDWIEKKLRKNKQSKPIKT